MDQVETHMGPVAYRRAGAGAPLVLLHGGLSDGRSWAPQLETLAREYDAAVRAFLRRVPGAAGG